MFLIENLKSKCRKIRRSAKSKMQQTPGISLDEMVSQVDKIRKAGTLVGVSSPYSSIKNTKDLSSDDLQFREIVKSLS